MFQVNESIEWVIKTIRSVQTTGVEASFNIPTTSHGIVRCVVRGGYTAPTTVLFIERDVEDRDPVKAFRHFGVSSEIEISDVFVCA